MQLRFPSLFSKFCSKSTATFSQKSDQSITPHSFIPTMYKMLKVTKILKKNQRTKHDHY